MKIYKQTKSNGSFSFSPLLFTLALLLSWMHLTAPSHLIIWFLLLLLPFTLLLFAMMQSSLDGLIFQTWEYSNEENFMEIEISFRHEMLLTKSDRIFIIFRNLFRESFLCVPRDLNISIQTVLNLFTAFYDRFWWQEKLLEHQNLF